MYKNRSRGFTLIELLVVIAIIGILSAVVLASLNTARDKGQDAAIQSDLSAVATQAEIYYGGTGLETYGAARWPSSGVSCAPGGVVATTASVFTDPQIQKAITAAETATGGTIGATAKCTSTGTSYVIEVPMVTETTAGTTDYWCLDSTGTAKKTTGVIDNTSVACP